MTGIFITLEGGEGSGKSTQITLLAQAFLNAGKPCVRTREPGGSTGAEKIRSLLVNGHAEDWDPFTETLLFYAARLDHITRLIKPALAAGNIVISDRFADSTRVYQGVGKQVPKAFITKLHTLVLGDFAPHLTIVLDIDPAIGLKRAHERQAGEGRFESMALAFHQAVREGFLDIAEQEPNRCIIVDASQKAAAVHACIIALVNERLGYTLKPHG